VGDFWEVMLATYEGRDRVATHSRREFEDLSERLAERVWADVAYACDKPVAAIACFAINRRVLCSFYICQDPEARGLQGLSLVLLEGLRRAHEGGFRWFDFGTSSVSGVARPQVFHFKEGFSRSGILRETLVWNADPAL
jgi:lipid II:glycine glycyltransferase (peptidoglycan interpeptide bridge formation enzyme)